MYNLYRLVEGVMLYRMGLKARYLSRKEDDTERAFRVVLFEFEHGGDNAAKHA
jgi:hypothetical protein